MMGRVSHKNDAGGTQHLWNNLNYRKKYVIKNILDLKLKLGTQH